MKNIYIILSIFICFNVSARINDFETTRLKSTSGAGIGSYLVDESSILNPAPLAFSNLSAIYFQKAGANFTSDNESPLTREESDQIAVIGSDSKGNVKGSISFTKYNQGFDQRKRFGLSMSKAAGKQSSLGVTYRITKDSLSEDGRDFTEDSFKQFIFGIFHAVNEDFSVGLVAVDPFKEREWDTRALIGMQYTYKQMIYFMLDAGADYNKDLAETFLYKAAMQVKVYNDFFIRFGTHRDRGLLQDGTGVGVGWLQPRLVLELAMKNTTFARLDEIDQVDSKSRDTSFSLSYRF